MHQAANGFFTICEFCDLNDPWLCPFEGMSDGIDELLRGFMSQCNEFRRADPLPPMTLWVHRITALQYLVVQPIHPAMIPMPVTLWLHLCRLEFARALEWWDAQ
jgi:hypothetical protein